MRLDRSVAASVIPWISIIIYGGAVTLGTFIGGLWAAFGIGGAIILFLATWMADGRVPRLDRIASLYILMLLGVILLLNFRAEYPVVAWHVLLQLTTILVPLSLLSSPQVQRRIDDKRMWPIVAVAIMVGGALLGLEFLANTPLLFAIKGPTAGATFYNRGSSYLCIFAFPVLAFLWTSGRRWQALALICLLLVPIQWTDSRATRTAFYIGSATTLLAMVAPLLVRLLLTLAFLVLMLVPWSATFLFLHDQDWIRHLPPSWQHRIEIWDYMSYRIFDRPFLGWGLGSSRFLDYTQPHGSSYIWVSENAGHPHDAVLQLWVELGIPGLILGAAFALFTLWRCGRLPLALRPFGYGTWAAALCVSLVAYNFWDDSLFSLFALTMLGFRGLAESRTREDRDAPGSASSMRATVPGEPSLEHDSGNAAQVFGGPLSAIVTSCHRLDVLRWSTEVVSIVRSRHG